LKPTSKPKTLHPNPRTLTAPKPQTPTTKPKTISAKPHTPHQAKDAGIYLFIGLAVKSETRSGGVVGVNPNVDVLGFFQELKP